MQPHLEPLAAASRSRLHSVIPLRHRFGLAVVPLVSALWLGTAQNAFPQTQSRCALAGTVFNSTTNTGIAHALVSYRGPAAGYRFTDAAGGFRVENVPAGQYFLTVSKPGFVSELELSSRQNIFALGSERAEVESTEQFTVTPSSTNVSVDLTPDSEPARINLLPVSSISGTILDENSEPLEGVSVQVIAVKVLLAGTDFAPVQTAVTDDRGSYLFMKLVPGDYIVRLAGEVSATHYYTGTLNPNNDHRGLRPVYYPNGDSTSSASVFHLAPGERANADFQQRTEAAFDINGRLSGFVPQVWTRMQLYRNGDRLPVARAFVNISRGSFRVIDVPPGSYTLRAAQYQADSDQWIAAEVPVNVTSAPISNLVVELSRAVDIAVTVAYEADAKEGPVHLTLEPQHSRENVRQLSIGMPSVPPESVNADTSQSVVQPNLKAERPSVFTNVIPDKYRLRATTFGSGYVASARLGEMDVLHREFSVGGGPGEIHIVVRGDSATVEGQVSSKNLLK